MWTIVLLFMWQFGSAMVIFLAALQNVPTALYEAAEIDGAGRAQQFWRITVPLITPVIFFNLIMQMVHAFQEFNSPYMVTEGGPAALHVRARALHLRPVLPLLQHRVWGGALLGALRDRRGACRNFVLDLALLGVLRRGRPQVKVFSRYAVLAIVSVLMLYPLIWLVGATFKTNAEIFTEIGFWPSRLDFGAYARGWKTEHRVHLRHVLPELLPHHDPAHRRDGDQLRAGGLRLRALRVLGQSAGSSQSWWGR
jgi:ABC-type glycerol-3-phosphate transport system permease component